MGGGKKKKGRGQQQTQQSNTQTGQPLHGTQQRRTDPEPQRSQSQPSVDPQPQQSSGVPRDQHHQHASQDQPSGVSQSRPQQLGAWARPRTQPLAAGHSKEVQPRTKKEQPLESRQPQEQRSQGQPVVIPRDEPRREQQQDVPYIQQSLHSTYTQQRENVPLPQQPGKQFQGTFRSGQEPPKGSSQQPSRGRGRGRGKSPQVGRGSSPKSPPPVGQPEVSLHRQIQQPQQTTSSAEQEPQQAQSGELSTIESDVLIEPGTRGRPIIVETNHLLLKLGKLTTVVHYDVKITPERPKYLLKGVLENIRAQNYSNRCPAFDGRRNLYSSTMLPFGDTFSSDIVIQIPDGKKYTFKVEIKFANYVDMTPLRDLLKPKATPREALQVVDVVLRSAPARMCFPCGRSFFTKPNQTINLGDGMEMYTGFYQSAVRGWKPFLNVDVVHKAVPLNANLPDVLIDLFNNRYQSYTRESLRQPLNGYQEETFKKYIRDLKISYEIPNYPSSRRTHTVNGLSGAANIETFTSDSGEQLTVEQYFAIKKNCKLRYPHLPTIWVGDKKRENKILLPLELCTIVEGQMLNREMTGNQTREMIRYAATSTDVRKDKIMTSLRQTNHNAHPSLREFGFSIADQFERVEARVLKPPSLQYKAKDPVIPSKGVWRAGNFFNGIKINKWTIACVDRRPAHPDQLDELARQVCRSATFLGMTIPPAEKPFVHIRGSNTIDDIKKYFFTQKEKNYDVIFVIVPNDGPQYSFVKTAAEINVGCLTQCIKMGTLTNIKSQIVNNILLKVNSKLNGTNHILQTPPRIMDYPCLIMGADVTHPRPKANRSDPVTEPSVAAVTACHDLAAFQYNLSFRLQPPRTEILQDLEAITKEKLVRFFKKTGRKPQRIVFFRDGVSEGEFEKVKNTEVRAIRAACKKLENGYEPPITFLVVQKRHHTRFFPTDPGDCKDDRNKNVPAGTVVDKTITHPFMQDYYLVSHASIKGVARPTKYCTLWDDNSMSNDDIEELTYYLCHMFTRCTRSVSYPAPTYYAHLAAARAKVYIQNRSLNMDDLQGELQRIQLQDVIRDNLPMFFV